MDGKGHEVDTSSKRQVMIVDQHEACRTAASDMIQHAADIAVAGAAASPVAGELAARISPDAILVGMDGTDGNDILHELRRSAPNAGIVVMSERDDAPALLGAVRSGATGFLPRYAKADEVLDALRTVATGGVAIHPALTATSVMYAARTLDESAEAGARYWRLTPRERETLDWLVEGLTARAIGERMVVSRRTVERHLANAYRKLGTHNRQDAIREYKRLATLATRELAS